MNNHSPNVEDAQSNHGQAPQSQNQGLLPCPTTDPEITSSGQFHQLASSWTLNASATEAATAASSILAWIQSPDAPYSARNERTIATPKYATEERSWSQAFSTMVKQGSTASEDGEDESEIKATDDQAQNKGSKQSKGP